MSRKGTSIIKACTLSFILLLMTLTAQIVSDASDKIREYSGIKLQQTDRKVQINLENQSLKEILHAVHTKSGILFEISPQLKEKPFTATITADDWTAAVRKLLKDFNRIEFLNPDGSLQKVRIVESSNEPTPLSHESTIPQQDNTVSGPDSIINSPPIPTSPPPPTLDPPSF